MLVKCDYWTKEWLKKKQQGLRMHGKIVISPRQPSLETNQISAPLTCNHIKGGREGVHPLAL